MDVYQLLNARFGGLTEVLEDPEVTATAVADVVFLRQDPRRLAFILVIEGANACVIRASNPAAAAVGIPCGAGSITGIGYPDDAHLAALEWHIFCAAGVTAIKVYSIRYTEQEGTPLPGGGPF